MPSVHACAIDQKWRERIPPFLAYNDHIFLEEGLVITHSRSLTSGKISSQLFALAIPLLIGNILQQLYNVAAAVIVGQYIGEEAFAAIGVAGTVMNLFIFVLVGGCTGVAIILASLFGSGDFHSLRKESFLAIVFGAGFTLVVSLVSITLLSPLLESINTPVEIFAYTKQYLLIILAGLPATFFLQPLRSSSPGSRQYPLCPLLPDDRGCRQCRTDLCPGCADGMGHYRRSLGDRVFSGTFSPALYGVY